MGYNADIMGLSSFC